MSPCFFGYKNPSGTALGCTSSGSRLGTAGLALHEGCPRAISCGCAAPQKKPRTRVDWRCIGGGEIGTLSLVLSPGHPEG